MAFSSSVFFFFEGLTEMREAVRGFECGAAKPARDP